MDAIYESQVLCQQACQKQMSFKSERAAPQGINACIKEQKCAGLLPDRGTLELPPTQWVDQMRTPPAEILLAEFRQQQGHAA